MSGLCAYEGRSGRVCGLSEEHNNHHHAGPLGPCGDGPTLGCHPFTPVPAQQPEPAMLARDAYYLIAHDTLTAVEGVAVIERRIRAATEKLRAENATLRARLDTATGLLAEVIPGHSVAYVSASLHRRVRAFLANKDDHA